MARHLKCHSLPPLKESRPEVPDQEWAGMLGTWICPKEIGKNLLEIMFSFPSSFFLGMVIPLDIVHSSFFPSGTSFFAVEDFHRVFYV
jgi:hypothetical protein